MSDGGLRLRIVGSSSAVPRAGRACSAYLFEAGDTALAVEFGTGALQSLTRFLAPANLHAVAISHMHPDHYMDLVQLRFALRLGTPQREKPLPVYVPPGGIARMDAIGEAVRTNAPDFFAENLELHEYDPDADLEIGAIRVQFVRSRHYIEAYAMRITANGRTVTFSADTAPDAAVVEAARDADVFLCECALGPGGKDGETRGHSNAREAGEMARDAGVKHLVLTHYGAQSAPDELRRAAASVYSGAITVADDGMEF